MAGLAQVVVAPPMWPKEDDTGASQVRGVHINFINIKVSKLQELMWGAQAVAKALNWLMWSRNPEVENLNIFVDVHIVSIKHGRFLCSLAKHKNLSTNRVFNHSCEILWSEKVTNISQNIQPSLLMNTIALSSKQQLLGSWCHLQLQKGKPRNGFIRSNTSVVMKKLLI